MVFGAVGNKVSHISSTLHRVVIMARPYHSLPLSQLRVLASHKTNFESVAQGTWELDLLKLRKCHFLSDPSVLDISSKKRCL